MSDATEIDEAAKRDFAFRRGRSAGWDAAMASMDLASFLPRLDALRDKLYEMNHEATAIRDDWWRLQVEIIAGKEVAAREDTERPDICGVSCAAGPNGEPLACGYDSGHDGSHSWASLPTWTDRWRIVHQPHRDPKKSSLAIEGPPCGSQVVYGVAMDRGVPAHERAVRNTGQEPER